MSKKQAKIDRKRELIKEALKLKKLHTQIVQWGYDKGIIQAANPIAQWEKTQEEVNELREALQNKDLDGITDAIGDSIVTLFLQAEMQKINIVDCLQGVYDIISKRSGVIKDGKFVKDK
jgi:NTP pyrophosphatase (non-canonical NTP hydrolase)|nr:MAG TPA: NTP-PPase-like protein [Caudoviricetes sp.]